MPRVNRFQPWAGPFLAAVLACLLTVGGGVATAVAGGGVLRSDLDRPARLPPAWLMAGPSVGGSPDWDPLTLGGAAAILLPPARAADLFPPCWDWNCGLVLGGEYRDIGDRRNLVVLDLGLRRYVGAPRPGDPRPVPFAGVALGIALASFPVGGGTVVDSTGAAVAVPPRHAEERWFTTAVDLGYQWRPHPRITCAALARWRTYIHRPRDYSHWSVQFLIGIPTPW